ncbi:hypothetical protein Efla_001041 [Eimeria flavescens]
MSVAEAPGAISTPPSSVQIAGKGSAARGRGCKIGRGLPLQQRKAYRNLARQTPRVQGLTFDHNQIRWISYWKNEQNKQVQKHFPVSRYGFLGARRLALEERNRIMGRPPDADEAAEAIANLKIDPSIPCFLEWNSPSQHEEVQAVEVEDEVTCTSAETWHEDEGDSATEAHRTEPTDVTGGSSDNVGPLFGILTPKFSPGHLHHMDVEAGHHGASMTGAAIADFHASPKRRSGELLESADILDPSFAAVESARRADSHVQLGGGGKRCSVASVTEVFTRSCKVDDVNDEFLSRTMTRTTTAAQDACTERHFMSTDRTTSSTSACFEEPDMQADSSLVPLTPQEETHRGAPPHSDQTETFKRPAPPALSPVVIAWEDRASSIDLSADTGPMSLFCTTEGERRAACSSPSALVHGPRRVGFNDIEAPGLPFYDAFIGGGYFSPRAASSEGGSPTQSLSRANTMREVFDFWDSRKSLCTSLVHDLFQGIRSSGMLSPTGASASSAAGMTPAEVRGRDFLEREEAMHCIAIEEAKGFDQLDPYLETFRHCLVASLMPSQLPRGEMISMVWTLRYRLLLPWGKSTVQRNYEQQFGAPPQNVSPFRERQGMTHRLLTDGANGGAHLTMDLSTASAIGLGSPTAAVGRTSGFIPPPSLFFGPAHAPASPTAALYGGCFSNATEQDHPPAAL